MNSKLENFSEVPIVWKPNENVERRTRKFMKIIENKYNRKFEGYWDFHQWTIENIPEFWEEMWDYSGVIHSKKYDKIVDMSMPMFKLPKWFEGAKLNFAENLLKYRDDKIAYIITGEDVDTYKVTYAEVYEQAKLYAAAFRKFGVRKGDVVMCYMSNRIEAIYGMLATISIGATWAGVLPQMGPEAALNRVSQVNPRLLLTVDRFLFNGEETDMLPKLQEIATGLPSLEKVLIVPSKKESKSKDISKIKNSCFLDEFLELGRGKDGSIPEMKFEQVPVSHPIFISFTSGTTGLPKGLVHGSGILLTITSCNLHMDSDRGDVWLSVSPVGWVTWCSFSTLLFLGITTVLYDGTPFNLSPTSTWDLIDEFQITHLFLPASTLEEHDKKEYLPTKQHSLKSLKLFIAAGSVVKLRSYDFVYNDLKLDVLFSSPYACTEIIDCIATGDFTLPVYKGEIPAPTFGVLIECYDESTGKPVEGTVGEMVLSTPTPGMFVSLVGDEDGSKAKEKYFSKYEGKYSLGDNGYINPVTKGIIFCGRCDETLKQRGCRFGSSEIYDVVEHFPEVYDSLCVSQYNKILDERAVLFLKIREGHTFNQDLVTRIRKRIARDLTPRHVPDVIIETQEIPFNTNGKKMEILVKKLINNMPYNMETLDNPESLKYYHNRPELQDDF